MAIPSNVEVPLPNSSIMANDFDVPCNSTLLVYYISMKNVLFPNSNRSDAPILVNTRSIMSHL